MNDMSRRVLPPQGLDPEEPERPRAGRSGPFGVLDIGSTKIVCLIGRTESDGRLRVLGFGWHKGKGVRGGGIVDLEEAEPSISPAASPKAASSTSNGRSVPDDPWKKPMSAASSPKAGSAPRLPGARSSTPCR
jgi:cell division protein FtsA